jgi:3-isopropylmalate dehydrogenase
MLLSVAMLLNWLGKQNKAANFSNAGNALQNAIEATLANPTTRTRDIGGSIGTKAFSAAVINHLETA